LPVYYGDYLLWQGTVLGEPGAGQPVKTGKAVPAYKEWAYLKKRAVREVLSITGKASPDLS
jgi:hypothetical protein